MSQQLLQVKMRFAHRQAKFECELVKALVDIWVVIYPDRNLIQASFQTGDIIGIQGLHAYMHMHMVQAQLSC